MRTVRTRRTWALLLTCFAGVSLRALPKTLFGEVAPQGRLPVEIPGAGDPGTILFPFGHGLTY
jgi:beta-N-acetylhexosaminidase